MKKVLILSFDLIRTGEVEKALAIASLTVYLKADKRYGHDFNIFHKTFNMWDLKNTVTDTFLEQVLNPLNIATFDTIAVSCYVWNEYLINPLLQKLRQMDFRGKIVLGGAQISYSDNKELAFTYPESDIFIKGYAEDSLLNAIFADKMLEPIVYDLPTDFASIPPIYASGEIELLQNQKMVRLETKRGCPYKCTFCAHRNVIKTRVEKHEKGKIFEELAFLKAKNVQKINMLDPIFNQGKDYLDIMREIDRIGLKAQISLQTRFEFILGKDGEEFLNLAERIGAQLEFGIQTIIESEQALIKRGNKRETIAELLPELNARGIDYEISLIYGLPTQTVDTFKESIQFVLDNGCTNLVAYPLMLLRGTELFEQRSFFGFKEEILGDFNIPTVTSSHSFTKDNWLHMQTIADSKFRF
jgi:radical SAM superfamily enzyme YgiQ (UPF0313 family)